MRIVLIAGGLAVLSALGNSAAAQRFGAPSSVRAQQEPRQDRSQLEAQVRRAFARAVRMRVGLTEEQMRQLAPISRRHEQSRRQLLRDERQTRMALAAATMSDTANQKDVELLIQRLIDIQKRRIAILEDEQRDLGTVMTPVQRARYMAIQEQVRRRLEQARQRRRP